MQRIGLLSDSHGRDGITAEAVRVLVGRGAEALIHLGDIGSVEVLEALALALATPVSSGAKPVVHAVLGNTDRGRSALAAAADSLGIAFHETTGRLWLGVKRLVFQHGHLYSEMQAAFSEGVDYLCHGHTHRPRDQQVGSTRVLNPGALFRARTPTVGLLDVATDDFSLIEVTHGVR